jgi:hypothetical protein
MMINFTTGSVFKLKIVPNHEVEDGIAPLLLPGERVQVAAKTIRDYVVFTDRRLFAVNVMGITGSRIDTTILAYSKVQAFSIETAGSLDLDAVLELWFSGIGNARFEFKGSTDFTQLAQLIGSKCV